MRKKLGFLIVSTTLSSMILAQAANTANKPAAKTTAKSTQSTKTTKAPATDSKENKENIESKTTQSTQADSKDSKDSTNSTESKATKKKKPYKNQGFFLGVYGGISIFNINMSVLSETIYNDTKPTFNFGAKFGYFQFFNKYIGLRGVISIDYNTKHIMTKTAAGATLRDGYNANFMTWAGNLDLLINVYNGEKMRVTLLGGVGFGNAIHFFSELLEDDLYTFQGYLNTKYQLYYIPINLGVTFSIAKHHQVEVLARFTPFAFGEYWSSTYSGYAYVRPTIITLGYSYIF